MYRKDSTEWLKHLDFIIWDMVSLQLAFVLAYAVSGHGFNPYAQALYRNIAVFMEMADLVVIFSLGTLKNVLKIGHYKEFIITLKHGVALGATTVFFLFALQEGQHFSRLALVLTFAIYIVLTYLVRELWKWILKRKMAEGDDRSLMLVVTEDIARSVVEDIKKNNYARYKIAGLVVIDRDLTGRSIANVPVIANKDTAAEYICREWIDEVLIVISGVIPYPKELIEQFTETGVTIHLNLTKISNIPHMDEATPHLHVDFIPVATEQSRGLSTRVSMKQALKQQGFVGVGRKQTEWAAWMEREKEALTEIAQRHDFEIISLGTNRPHMDLPQFKEAAARLEAVQQQTAAVEREVAELERQRDALKGTVRLLKEADRVNAPLHDIQPEKTLTGAVKGVTVDQVEQLKKMALRSVTDRHKVQELTEENTRLRSQVPSMKKRLEEAQRQQRLEQENRRLRDENYYLQSELQEERSFTERLTDGIGRMLDFLEEHLPERLRPLLEKARELLPDPEIGQQQEQQQHQRGMGGMEL